MAGSNVTCLRLESPGDKYCGEEVAEGLYLPLVLPWSYLELSPLWSMLLLDEHLHQFIDGSIPENLTKTIHTHF